MRLNLWSSISDFRRYHPRAVPVFLAILAVLLISRLTLPYFLEDYVNRQLSRNPNYAGRIGKVRVHLWRGAYRIHDIQIIKITGKIQEPLYSAKYLDLSMEWNELIHGALVGEVEMLEPRINFVSGPTDEQTQTGANTDWGDILESLFPFKLNRLEIRHGEVHFQNHYSTPPVDIFMHEVSATATNLTNTRALKDPLPASVKASGKTIGRGDFKIDLRLNPLKSAPTFELAAQMSNVDLPALNDFMRAYGKFDVASGDFSMFASIASKDNQYTGYVKVFFQELDVFSWEKERKKNIAQIFWQAVVGTLTTVLKNHSKDTLATKIPISGSYNKTTLGTWTAVANLLQNAFIRALVPKLDNQTKLEEIEEPEPPPLDKTPKRPQPHSQ
jgi:hypothetical protein